MTTKRNLFKAHILESSRLSPWTRLRFLCSGTVLRSSSTKAAGSSASLLRDQRLAGRRRFYKNVDIQPLSRYPWSSPEDEVIGIVESPIPAGVDGSRSASGVHHHKSAPRSSSPTMIQHQLTPRKPNILSLEAGGDIKNVSKKFTSINEEDLSWYGVSLDGRLIQTPMGRTLMVPSALWAGQIAAEWDSVKTKILPTQMPCMTLTCTVLDQTAFHPEIYQQQVTRFVPTDTICYYAHPNEDRVLYQRQQDAWTHIHSRVEQVIGTKLATVSSTEQGMIMTLGRGGLPHDPVLLEYASEFCATLDAWHLTALQSLAVEAKSFWLAWALLTQQYYHADGDVSFPLVFKEVVDAVHASRVEEEFQISMWGMVEGQHDYDRINTSVKVSSALLLVNSLAIDCRLK